MNYLFVLDDDLTKSYLNTTSKEKMIEYSYMKFSGGEPHITIKNLRKYDNAENVVFVAKIKNGDDLLKLAAAVDAFDHLGTGAAHHLEIAYYPGGRQDRVCNPGEAFTAKVYANLINKMTNWDSIQVLDQHSDVTSAVLDNAVHNNNHWFVCNALNVIDLHRGTIVSPDAGANKKIYDLAKYLNNHEEDFNFNVIRADKLRDLKTGNIIETTVYAEDLSGQECIIIDDICDGGRTFIELAKVLKAKGAKNVVLLVTHGIFSKGFGPVLEEVDQIVTTNSFMESWRDDNDRVIVLGINEDYFTRR